MNWVRKHKHRWWPLAVKHGTVESSGGAGTQVLLQCQDESCGAYATQTIFGSWELEEVRRNVPDHEVAELRRMMGWK
jgi:hypothetical protein